MAAQAKTDTVHSVQKEAPVKRTKPSLAKPWQIGKTVATVDFVLRAEKYLDICFDKVVSDQLQAYVDRLKSGQESLKDEMSIDHYLKRN